MCLLVDADRDPAQAVQVGFLGPVDLDGRGLAHLVLAHRERRPLTDELWRQSVTLSTHDRVNRRFVPGFPHPGTASVFAAVWADFAATLAHLDVAATDAIVDAGRIGREGVPAGLLAASSMVLVCVRSSLKSLAAARLHLPGLVKQAGVAGHAEVGLVVIGAGKPYSPAEIGHQFGLPVLATLPDEPELARVLSDGDEEPKRFIDSSLMRGFGGAAAQLRANMAASRAVLEGGQSEQWVDLHRSVAS